MAVGGVLSELEAELEAWQFRVIYYQDNLSDHQLKEQIAYLLKLAYRAQQERRDHEHELAQRTQELEHA